MAPPLPGPAPEACPERLAPGLGAGVGTPQGPPSCCPPGNPGEGGSTQHHPTKGNGLGRGRLSHILCLLPKIPVCAQPPTPPPS